MPKHRLNDVGVVQAKRLSVLHTLHNVVVAGQSAAAVAFVIQIDGESEQTVPDGQFRISPLLFPLKQAAKDDWVRHATPDNVPHVKQTAFVVYAKLASATTIVN